MQIENQNENIVVFDTFCFVLFIWHFGNFDGYVNEINHTCRTSTIQISLVQVKSQLFKYEALEWL